MGDGFILSPKFCGSEATGYASTKEFMNDKMTLATAMAASGAAVNPNAGAAGSGPTTSASLSFLMTFFGLRLGIWVPNPRWRFLTGSGSNLLPPNYIFPGLKSLLSFGQAETNYRIELSDGAHFDSTGLYELVRRRVTTIILSEAGADKDFTLGDLGNAIEKARVDFGVRIIFGEFDLDGIIPGSRAAVEKGAGKVFAENFHSAAMRSPPYITPRTEKSRPKPEPWSLSRRRWCAIFPAIFMPTKRSTRFSPTNPRRISFLMNGSSRRTASWVTSWLNRPWPNWLERKRFYFKVSSPVSM